MAGYRYRGENQDFAGFVATEVIVDNNRAMPFLIKVTAEKPSVNFLAPRSMQKFYYITWVGFTLDWLEIE